MAEVTVYGAARMKQIEDTSVVNGDIDVNNHLILTRHNGTEIDAGLLGNNPLRDTVANLAANNPVVEAGRIIVTTNATPQLFAFGDGVTGWNSLQKYEAQTAVQDYVPVVKQGGVTKTKTTIYSRYHRRGKFIHFQFRFTLTQAGTTGTFEVSTPVAAHASEDDIAIGVGKFAGTPCIWAIYDTVITPQLSTTGAYPTTAVANGSTYDGSVTFEALT